MNMTGLAPHIALSPWAGREVAASGWLRVLHRFADEFSGDRKVARLIRVPHP